MPLSKPLSALQQELRDILTDDLNAALQAAKHYLPEGGARYQQVLALIARLNDANKERYRNTLSADDYQRRIDTIRSNSFDLIESLQESDFTAPRPNTTQRKNRNARRKKQARLWHQPAFWGGVATLVTLLIALLAYLNDLGVFPFRPKNGEKDRAAYTRSQAAAACGFPETFDSTHLYILITRFEDFANDNETECYGRSIESRIDMVKNRENLPVKICYIDSLSPNQSEQADRLRDLYHADLIIWGKLRNAGPECSADGLCLNFQPSDTLIRYAGGEVRKKVDNEYRPNISAADLESGLISMGAESFDAWLISMVNMKIGQRKPEFYRIAEDWSVEKKAEEYKRRGDLFKLINEKDKAIADYSEAFRLQPTPTILLTRALAYLYWGENDKSISDCTLVLKLDSTASIAYIIRGRSKLFLDQYDDALEHVEKFNLANILVCSRLPNNLLKESTIPNFLRFSRGLYPVGDRS